MLHLMGTTKEKLLITQRFKDIQHTGKTKFYTDLLSTWYNFIKSDIKSISDLLDEPIFNNPLLTINNNLLVDRHSIWEKAGIIKVSDILSDDSKSFISKLDLQIKYNISISDMFYNQLTSMLLNILKSLPKVVTMPPLKYQNIPNKCFAKISKTTSSQVNSYLAVSEYRSPLSQEKWIQYYPFLESLNWENIYILPFRVVSDTYLMTLQYKILHRVYACNEQLHIWKIIESPLCKYCSNHENLEHFFFCADTRHFWHEVSKWLSHKISLAINLTVLEVLFGLPNIDPKFYFAANYAILTGKHLISKAKKELELFNLEKFQKCLKWNLKTERYIYQSQCRLSVFQERFSILD